MAGDSPPVTNPMQIRAFARKHTSSSWALFFWVADATIFNGVVVGSVYALFALGLTLLFGVNHIMNMVHGSAFMWGAFAGL